MGKPAARMRPASDVSSASDGHPLCPLCRGTTLPTPTNLVKKWQCYRDREKVSK